MKKKRFPLLTMHVLSYMFPYNKKMVTDTNNGNKVFDPHMYDFLVEHDLKNLDYRKLKSFYERFGKIYLPIEGGLTEKEKEDYDDTLKSLGLILLLLDQRPVLQFNDNFRKRISVIESNLTLCMNKIFEQKSFQVPFSNYPETFDDMLRYAYHTSTFHDVLGRCNDYEAFYGGRVKLWYLIALSIESIKKQMEK